MIIRPQRDPVETYLHEVANRLRGPRRLREDMLCELRSGVLDAVEIRCRAGMARPDAARSATAEFGAARVVASTFNAELVLAQARRSTRAMLVTGPMVAALWIVAAITNHLGLTFPPPLDWAEPGGPVDGVVRTTARIAVYGTCVAIALLAVAAFYTVLTTGRLSGWLSSPVRIDVAAAAIASAAAILADCGILTALGMRLISGFGLLAPLPVAAAVLASCARIVLTARAGRHFAGRRSALG